MALICFFLIVISALAGLFSHGFLSDRTQETGDKQLQVHYERFGRLQSDMALAITVRAPKHEQLVITLGGDFMQQYEIRTLQPQPDQSPVETEYCVWNIPTRIRETPLIFGWG